MYYVECLYWLILCSTIEYYCINMVLYKLINVYNIGNSNDLICLYCNAHFLLGLSHKCESTLKESLKKQIRN